jgi:ribosomal protein S27E
MGLKRCSGATAFSQPKIEVVPCPDCGTDVEVWSDEATGQCPSCSRTVIRTATQSCVDWCR